MTRIDRRHALLALTGVLLAAPPAAAQAPRYNEAPGLAEQVRANRLPPVANRLPEQPLVVPVVERVGDYGGVWRRAFLGPADANNYVRVAYDSLFRFSPDGAKIEPKVAAGAQPSADFKTWTVSLRKGSRWSDGAPFGADDILFWYKDVLLNKDLSPSIPAWVRNADGTAAKVEKIDDVTVRFTYNEPATLLSCRPRLLIADEPTTAIDVTTQAQVLALPKELQRKYGTAIIFITHDLGVIAQMAAHVVVMYLGRVMEQGPVDDIFHAPQHPYTRALLRSIPSLYGATRSPLPVISGALPHPFNRPPGCPFHPRCADFMADRCAGAVPVLMPVNDHQSASCFLYSDAAEPG